MGNVNIEQKTTFVVDASFVLAYLLPDEKDKNVGKMFSKFEKNQIAFISSHLLAFEVSNGLRSAVLQGRQEAKAARLLLDSFLNMGIIFEKINGKEVFDLSLEKSISIYDASYAWLAKSKKIKLLTLDESLSRVLK